MARTDDIGDVSRVAVDAFAKWVPVLGRKPGPMTMDYTSAIRRGEIRLFKLNGQVCAFVRVIQQPQQLFVDVLAVQTSHQNRGIGSILLRWVEQKAGNCSLRSVGLKTVAAYTSNIDFYERRGFSIEAHESFESVPIVVMRRPLNLSQPE